MGGVLSSTETAKPPASAPRARPVIARETAKPGSITDQDPETQLSRENTICHYIKPIIEPYIDLARAHPVQNIGVPTHFLKNTNPTKVPVLRLSAFVYLVNASLQYSSNFTIPYIESIYNMADMTQTCNGIINIKYMSLIPDNVKDSTKYILEDYIEAKDNPNFKPYFYFRGETIIDEERQKIYIPIPEYKDISQNTVTQYTHVSYNDKNEEQYTLSNPQESHSHLGLSFLRRFSHQYDNAQCKFISIAINFVCTRSAHANMLLIYKGSTKVYIMLYEPHGADGLRIQEPYNTQYKAMKKQFIWFVTAIINKKGKTVEQIKSGNISVPRGIQIYMGDKHGYCYMISSFWLYIILNIVKTSIPETEFEKFFLNLNYIEQCVYNIIYNEIQADNSQTPQSASRSSAPLSAIRQGSFKGYTPPQVLYSVIVHFSYDFLTKYYLPYLVGNSHLYGIFTRTFNDKYDDQRKNPEKFDKVILIKYDDKTGSNVNAKRLEDMKLKADEIPTRTDIGGDCAENRNCQSYKCSKEKKCIPRESYDYGSQATAGSQSQSQSQSSADSTQYDIQLSRLHNPEPKDLASEAPDYDEFKYDIAEDVSIQLEPMAGVTNRYGREIFFQLEPMAGVANTDESSNRSKKPINIIRRIRSKRGAESSNPNPIVLDKNIAKSSNPESLSKKHRPASPESSDVDLPEMDEDSNVTPDSPAPSEVDLPEM